MADRLGLASRSAHWVKRSDCLGAKLNNSVSARQRRWRSKRAARLVESLRNDLLEHVILGLGWFMSLDESGLRGKTGLASGTCEPYNDVRMEVWYMATERLDVRLDHERRRKLAELAAARSSSVSEVVREMIDQAYEEGLRADRVRAARELAQLAVEDVPDPETLRRQLEGTYDSAHLP
jgi:hypothetical protein